jgi:hypothetical protein
MRNAGILDDSRFHPFLGAESEGKILYDSTFHAFLGSDDLKESMWMILDFMYYRRIHPSIHPSIHSSYIIPDFMHY